MGIGFSFGIPLKPSQKDHLFRSFGCECITDGHHDDGHLFRTSFLSDGVSFHKDHKKELKPILPISFWVSC